MTNKQMIKHARQQLNAGNKEAYIRVMTSHIRAAMSTKTANAIITAVKEDGLLVTFKQNGAI